VVSETSKRAPWDQRLAEGMARESWEAANDPEAYRRRNPPLREQIRSPCFWLSMLAAAAASFVFFSAKPGWTAALALVLYLGAVVAGRIGIRHVRAARLLRNAAKETM
jgi:hypothetical protein